ncbi:MAG TPA: ABC transporter ATP-binding protein [Candidatus Polarisedimenticolia bacterium]|nr:ABC transporter ATP-binding protein [Candidatus Polarisedimenticolia bacterium]
MSSPSLIETRGLGRVFGSRTALRHVGLMVGAGEILALFGPNGAGKTTLLRILATLLRPSRGQAFLGGMDIASRPLRVVLRRRIGVLLHQLMLYDRLTAEENLLFYARMYSVPSPRDRCRGLLRDLGLAGREDDLVRDYSRGMQQRLAIARALVHDPDLLLLDEPFSGLDPQASAVVSGQLQKLAERGKCLIFTSHDLEGGLALGHRAAILARGGIVFDAPRERIDPARFPATYEAAVASRPGGG